MTILTKIGLPLVLLMSSFLCVHCEVDTKINVSQENPPKFSFSGTGTLYFLEVSEITRDNPNAPITLQNSKPYKLIWRIVPRGSINRRMDRRSPVSYGIVTDDYEQTDPATGQAPALEEGKTYFALAMTGGAGSGRAWFTIKEGRAVTLPEPEDLPR